MAKLKNIHLINFCGYEDTFFDFSSPAGCLFRRGIKPLALFYGPNGSGKSSVLEAIKLISNPLVLQNRCTPVESILRSSIRDDDSNPIADAISNKEKRSMRVEATFVSTEGEKKVILTDKGFIVNELPLSHNGHVFYVDADHPINWSKFQLISDHADKFIDLAETIFGFDCDLGGEVWDSIAEADGSVSKHLYYQDLIITKGNSKVHFANMSAGEKKIATVIRQLCDPDNLLNKEIVLIDNLDLHVYYKRHVKMLDKIMEYLGDRQLIATTHSAVLIAHAPQSCRYDMAMYRPEYALLGDTMEDKELITSDQFEFSKSNFRRVVLVDGTVVIATPENADKVQHLYNISIRSDIVSKEQYQEDVAKGVDYSIHNSDAMPSSETVQDAANLSDFYETSNNPTIDTQLSPKRVGVPNKNASPYLPEKAKSSIWTRFRSLFAW
jgi:AAA15 family ATPase/GTPase